MTSKLKGYDKAWKKHFHVPGQRKGSKVGVPPRSFDVDIQIVRAGVSGRFRQGLEIVRKSVAWEYVPPIGADSRSARFDTKRLLSLSGFSPVDDYKVKGVGTNLQSNDGSRILTFPNVGLVYVPQDFDGNPQLTTKMKITADGNFVSRVSTPEPYGGASATAVNNELATFERLLEYGVNVEIPLAIFINKSLEFGQDHIRALALGCLQGNWSITADFYRDSSRGQLLNERMAEVAKDRDPRIINADEKDQVLFVLQMWKEIEEAKGAETRKIHEAGVGILEPHVDNSKYDHKAQKILLHDFTTCRNFDDLPQNIIGMVILRDVAMSLYQVFASIIYSSVSFNCREEGLKEQFRSNNPFRAFLKGYFGDELDDPSIVDLVNILNSLLFSVFEGLPDEADFQTRTERINPILSRSSRILSTIMGSLVNAYNSSRLASRHPVPYEQNALLRKLLKYEDDERGRCLDLVNTLGSVIDQPLEYLLHPDKQEHGLLGILNPPKEQAW